MAKFLFVQAIFVSLTHWALSTCPYYIDIFNCVNINCNGKKNLTEISSSITDLVHYEFKSVNLLCSLDLSNTGIVEISSKTISNLNHILEILAEKNFKQKSTIIKISFSNINQIRVLNTSANLAFFIYDSRIKFIEPKSFRNLKLELYLMNVSLTILNWINLLNDARFKLLNIRDIQVGKSAFYDLEPIGSVKDLKFFNMFIPILDEKEFLFPLVDLVEQLEIVNCSVTIIKSSFLKKFKTVKYLTMSSNNLTKIDDSLFQDLDELEFLDLDANPIEYIHPKAFNSLRKLRTLSINSDFLKFSHFGYKWLYNSLELIKLNDLSMRNPTSISNFCSLYQIVKYFNRINQNLLGNKFLTEQYTVNERRLKLFGTDQIGLGLSELFKDKNLFCSVYFVCIYAKNYSSIYLNTWSLEYFVVCPEVLSLNDNIEFICEFHQKVDKCSQSLQVRSESHENIVDETHEISLTNIFVKFNLLIFIISFVLVLTAFALVFFLSVSLIKKKYIFQKTRRNTIKNRRQNHKWLNNSLDSEYYVVLMNKKHVKI